jgi:uncharacterized protein involved in exopolysaccharide biosynthesis
MAARAVSGTIGLGKRMLVFARLTHELAPYEQAVVDFSEKVLVSPVRKSDVIEVTLESKNPVKAAEAVNALVALYLQHHNVLYQADGAYEFFDTQADQSLLKLQDSEDALYAFRRANNVVTLEEQKSLLLSRSADTTRDLEATRSEIAEIAARARQNRDRLTTLAANVELNQIRERRPILEQLDERVADLRLQREELLARYRPDARPVQDVERELEGLLDLQQQVQAMPDEQNVGGDPVSSVTLGENVTYKDLEGIVLADEARTVSLRARERQLDQTVSAGARRLNDLVDLEVENKRLTRQVEADEGNYEVQRKALEERRISVQMDLEQIASVSVIEAATVPLQPIGPRKLLAVALSIPLGFLLGLGFAFISERSDRSFTREEDVERANDAPVIGTLPDSGNSTSDAPKRDGRGRASRRQRRRGSEPGGEHS